MIVLLLLFLVCYQCSRMAVTKVLSVLFDELEREVKSDLRELKESFDRELRKQLRKIRASLTFINRTNRRD